MQFCFLLFYYSLGITQGESLDSPKDPGCWGSVWLTLQMARSLCSRSSFLIVVSGTNCSMNVPGEMDLTLVQLPCLEGDP